MKVEGKWIYTKNEMGDLIYHCNKCSYKFSLSYVNPDWPEICPQCKSDMRKKKKKRRRTMNNKEAIKILQDELKHTEFHLKDKNKADEFYTEMKLYCEAFRLAIKSLEEKNNG